MNFRTIVRPTDIYYTRKILERTEMFLPFELTWVEDMIEETLLDPRADSYHYIFAEENGTVVGFAIAGKIDEHHGDRWDLFWIAIDPDAQGKGLGKRLLEEIELVAQHNDATHMYIETGSWNDAANALYKKAGYKFMGKLEDYYVNGGDKHFWGKRFHHAFK